MSMMGWAVFSYQPAPIQTEYDMEIGKTYVMDNLIIGPLKEG
jgi:hypothetical protein